MKRALSLLSLFTAAIFGFESGAAENKKLPSLEEAIAAKEDLWGEAALKQPGGPSYEFFENLLPPLRYVNADFRYYPLVLSAPQSAVKARLTSNGSAINALGGARSWNDVGIPVVFRVGPDELRFGEYFSRITGPRFLEGYLPVIQTDYQHGETTYHQEVFASVDPALSRHGVVFVRFRLSGDRGNVAAEIDSKSTLQFKTGHVDANQGAVVWFDPIWKPGRQLLTAVFNTNQSVTLAIATRPLSNSVAAPLANGGFEKQKKMAIDRWNQIVKSGMQVVTPEKRVNDAWRSHIIANYSLMHSNRIHYSAGNQYDKLYEAEGSDAALAMLHWGHQETTRDLIPPLLDFTRKGLEYHQAGHKLQTLAYFFWLTRDVEFLKQMRPRWEKEVQRILDGRQKENGLFPREQYCGDIATPVFSLNSNAKCWRALRDFAEVVDACGDGEKAGQLRREAKNFREAILSAVAKSERKDVQPPFIPIALLGEEEPYETITGTKMGSYYNLMVNYVLGSGVFGPDSEREKSLIDYIQQRGGLSMGMTRSRPNPTFWTGPSSLNPLYGQRYVITLLQRDEADRALVSFYGMLAQGMTRDTFIGGEGGSMRPLDENGRLFYCPPNSASNGFFLWMLRFLLVQDWDLDDNGDPETLRLLHATPRRWLEDGKTISVQNAPTAFGEISLKATSQLSRGRVLVDLDLPTRPAKKTSLRLRLPEGWQLQRGMVGAKAISADSSGAMDLSGLTGKIKMECNVGRK